MTNAIVVGDTNRGERDDIELEPAVQEAFERSADFSKQQGKVYDAIINGVVESSKNDFEEHGVDRQTLDELKNLWQNRLTQTQRATFPWDPQVAEPSAAPAPSTNTSVQTPRPPLVKQEEPPQQPPLQQPQQNQQADQVKQENSFETPPFLNLPNTVNYSQQSAQQRAAQLIQNQFGDQGQGSIAALHAAGQPSTAYGQRPNGASSATSNGQSATPGPQGSANIQGSSDVKSEQASSTLGMNQTDGAGDSAETWEDYLSKQRSLDPATRARADRIIRGQVDAMMNRMEGGGALVPLHERRQTKRRKVATLDRTAAASSSAEASTSSPNAAAMNQYDGGDDDDDEEDEDAINSDLDDPDDNLGDGIEGSMDGDLILCLYDKVQRVKNKWKCTLKDGVVSVAGKDYVFHKAQGEFEW